MHLSNNKGKNSNKNISESSVVGVIIALLMFFMAVDALILTVIDGSLFYVDISMMQMNSVIKYGILSAGDLCRFLGYLAGGLFLIRNRSRRGFAFAIILIIIGYICDCAYNAMDITKDLYSILWVVAVVPGIIVFILVFLKFVKKNTLLHKRIVVFAVLSLIWLLFNGTIESIIYLNVGQINFIRFIYILKAILGPIIAILLSIVKVPEKTVSNKNSKQTIGKNLSEQTIDVQLSESKNRGKTQKKTFCEECGEPLEAGHEYCENCGARISNKWDSDEMMV